MECPDAEEFAALLSHTLDAGRRADIVDHAAGCAGCYALIDQLAAALDTLGSVAPPPNEPPASDEPAALRRAVAGALRARETWNRIGRYHLLEIVGAGGMGVVWGAWDPQLARRVALKLVHPRLGAARERILAEGQALGKLSHPNVVPVYDVGVVDDQIYLVMEWVHGTTLRAYARSQPTMRGVVDAYRQAGEGLAAAHRAGLVHRDFKPDNAIRGEDGRVRVLDFGLARSDDDAPEVGKRLAGTPRYMAPEQAAGAPVTPAVDQYAFALSLGEALREQAARGQALPSWLAAIVARGTATEPAARFASMESLVRALGRDPTRIWRRRGLAAAAATTVAVAAFLIGSTRAAPPATCVGSAAEIARSWAPPARAAITGHLRELGPFAAAEADRLGEELDRYATAWASEHHRACLAHQRGELPSGLYERRSACLARGKAALATVAELMAAVPAAGVARALVAARSLPSVAGCGAADTSTVAPPPDAVALQVAAITPAIERAVVFATAARPDAVTVARAGVAAAERTGYAPLVARALVAEGRAELELEVGEAAAPASLRRAVDLALRGGDDVLAVEAYARLVWAVARYRGDVVDSWPTMEAIASRTGATGQFARALLYNNKASARLAAADRAGARALQLQALAAMPHTPLSDGEIELTAVLQGLALLADDPIEREARARQLVDRLETLLGPNHPNALAAHVVAATLTRNPVVAARDFQIACDGYRHWHPERTVALADCAFERAWLADDRGDTPGARAAMQLAVADPLSPREREKGTIAVRYVAITGGDADASTLQSLEQIAVKLASGAAWWTRGEAADAYVTAALGWDRLDQAREAERCWSAALALLEGVQQPMYERRLARVRATLARRWATARPADARRSAASAIAWYRGAGGYDSAVAALVAIAP